MPPTIHDFHLFITSSSSFHGFNTTELIQRPAPCRLVSSIGRALHRYRRGQGLESLGSLNFFSGLLFATAKVASIIEMIFFHAKNKQLCIVGFNTTELIQRPAPCRLVSSIGRALHRYRRGQGLESLGSLNFFSGLLFATAKVASIIEMIFFHAKNKQLCIVGEVSLNRHCRTVAFIFKVCRLSKAVSCTKHVVKKRRERRK